MKNVKYYANGAVKVVHGLVYSREKGGYVLDFYHDEDYLIKPENECNGKIALDEYIRIYGTDDGFTK